MTARELRGAWFPCSAEERIARAFELMTCIPTPPSGSPSDAGDRPIGYRLAGGYNGGDDPFAVFDVDFGGDDTTDRYPVGWSFGDRVPTMDCVGLVLGACQIDRKQPGYRGSVGEWLHCGSLIADAHGAQRFVELLDDSAGMPGDFMITAEHIGMILRRKTVHVDYLVIDCSPRHDAERVSSIGVGGPWSRSYTIARLRQPPGGVAVAAR